MNIGLTIVGGFVTMIGLLIVWTGILLNQLDVDRYKGKTVWLERSSEEPYFWSVSALDDKGDIKFVDGWQDKARARALFDGIVDGSVTRKWVREHDEEQTRRRNREYEATPKPILVEAR